MPTLFGHAQRYATFLGQELRFVDHATLVVVVGGSPRGIGVFGPGATPAAKVAVREIAVPVAGDARGVAVIASTAIRRVAATNGHVLTTPRAKAVHTRSRVLAVDFATGLVVYRRRR